MENTNNDDCWDSFEFHSVDGLLLNRDSAQWHGKETMVNGWFYFRARSLAYVSNIQKASVEKSDWLQQRLSSSLTH
jgi:hypothetical protein